MKEKVFNKSNLILFFKGVSMGAADVIPGVSGGTIAFITGIYDKLLASIKAFDLQALKYLLGFKISKLWEHVNGTFLTFLLSGIFLSIFSLANLMTYLMEYQPIPLWSFFSGLIIISSISILRKIKNWTFIAVVFLLIGIGIAYWVVSSTPSYTPEGLWFTFISGAIAICAMILPGISGSFILLLMNKYDYILLSVKSFDLPVLIVFAAGCATGIIAFSHVVTWMLKKYHDAAICLLAGFMIGSLHKIWPWKLVLQYRTNSKGEQVPFLEQNVLPQDFMTQTQEPALIGIAILFFVIGIILVWGIEKIAENVKQ